MLLGQYSPLTHFEKDGDGNLVGSIELPLAVGIVGGITRTHPQVMTNLKLLDITNATELASIIVSAGLAQNISALMALSTDGINKGHMKLHAKNLAIQLGAKQDELDAIFKLASKEQKYTPQDIENYMNIIRNKNSGEINATESN